MDPLQRITENISELVDGHTHREPFTVYRNGTWFTDQHITEVPSLLDQLGTAFERGSNGPDQDRGSFSSRPSARLDAIDTYMRIDTEARTKAQQMNLAPRHETADVLRSLVGGATRLEREDAYDLAGSTSSWTTWARVATGWEVPARRLDKNSCPLCEKKGGLRIRLGDGVTNQSAHGMCVNCGEHWTPDTIYLLAGHIRWENGEHEAAS
ncbi:MAG: DUF7341 domain-containing protein [Humibacter sp.]